MHKNIFYILIIAMAITVVISNFLVQFPINDWITWGAFSYPIVFLVTDITNRLFGIQGAKKIAALGFVLGVILSFFVADTRIAIASGSAFLVAQLIDIYLFSKIQNTQKKWWLAPSISSSAASVLDTALFFSIAFAGTALPWVGWAIGDLAAKFCMIFILLIPYKFAIQFLLVPRFSKV